MNNETGEAEGGRTLIRGTAWSILNQFVGQILVLVVFLVTARFVSKEDFGIMAGAMLFIEICRQIVIESVAIGLLAKYQPTEEFCSAAFFCSVGAALFTTLAIFLAAPLVGELVAQDDVGWALQLLSPVLVLSALGRVHEIVLSKHLQFKALAIRSIGSVFVGGAIGVWMAVEGMGVSSLVAQQVITAVVSAVWLWLTCSWRPRFNFNRLELRHVWTMAFPLSLNHAVSAVGIQGDVFFSSMHLGAAATGVFNASKRILTAINMILCSGFNSVAMPVLSGLGPENADLGKSFLKFTFITSLVTAPLYFGLSALAQPFITIVLGDKWIDAAPVLSIIAIAGYTSAVSQYTVNIMLIFGRANWVLCLTVTGAALNVLLLLLFASRGLTALAAVLVFKSLLFLPLNFYLALKLLNQRWIDLAKSLGPSVIAAMLMAGALYTAYPQLSHLGLGWSMAILLPTAALVYLTLCVAFDKKGMSRVYAMIAAAVGIH